MSLSPSLQRVMPPVALPGPAANRRFTVRSCLCKVIDHSDRCRAADRPGSAEVARIVAACLPNGERVRQCRAAFALPTANSAGCSADRWIG